jgi:predicted small lipoprotein YifL
MKIISRLLLVIFVTVTLAACGEMGKGPSRPKELNSIEIPQK